MPDPRIQRLKDNIASVFYGPTKAVDQLLIGLIGRGHVLVEDVPGVGKTVLCRALAKSIDCKFSRIQLTPDLLPSDVLGVSIYNNVTQTFDFKPGPIFANIVLADEINRTTPRTQSALLEAMSEEQVSFENQTFSLKRPFMVIATQNPFEFEGTYYLPENQLDRFLIRVAVGYPDRAAEAKILTVQPSRTRLDELKSVMTGDDVVSLQDKVPGVKLDSAIVNYILDIVEASRNDEEIHLGVSPRGSLALTAAVQASAILNGRDYALPDDVKALVIPVCAHRVISKAYLQSGDARMTARILQRIVDGIPVPN